jgi:hypothetical protein
MCSPGVAALVVRVVQALAVRTAFAPDEFWQSIEVAHRIVFGQVPASQASSCPTVTAAAACKPATRRLPHLNRRCPATT